MRFFSIFDPNNYCQIERQLAKMEDEQSLQIAGVSGSIYKMRRRVNENGRGNAGKNKSEIDRRIVIFATVFITILVFVLFGAFLWVRTEINLLKLGNTNKDYPKELTELRQKIRSLQKSLNQLQQRRQTQKSSATSGAAPIFANLSNSNSTEVVKYIDYKYEDLKLTINFVHDHIAQTFYYSKIANLKQVLNRGFQVPMDKAKTSFLQAMNNYRIPHPNIHIDKQIKQNLKKQEDRLSKQYDFNLPELPFCIVVPTLNNARNFRYQYNLQSMVNLQYKNFKIVIVDDASTDHTYELIKQWIAENNVIVDIVVIKNEKRMTAGPNIHKAITNHCGADSIVVLVDGDDEVLGRYPLKVFNHVYHKTKADVVYSNHLQFYTHTGNVYRGWSMSYTDQEKRNNRYRDVPQRIAHLRTFKTKLFLKIKDADLKDEKGEWLTSTYDEVICLPILQMSCGRNVYIQQFFYLYNFGIGTNDLQVDPGLQKNIADYVKFKKEKYKCLEQ